MRYGYVSVAVTVMFYVLFLSYSTYNLAANGPQQGSLSVVKGVYEKQKEPIDLTLMTYNIHYGVSMNGEYLLQNIIDVILEQEPDIIGLNEVDYLMPRSSMQRQDRILAKETGYHAIYGSNINMGAKYGNMLLSKHPIISWTNHRLPGNTGIFTEPRGLIEAVLDIDGTEVTVFVTHLSIITQERPQQIAFIIQKMNETTGPKIMLGDFNDIPSAENIRGLTEVMVDTGEGMEYATFSSEKPSARIDYIFVTEDFIIKDNHVIESMASDHLPVLARVRIP